MNRRRSHIPFAAALLLLGATLLFPVAASAQDGYMRIITSTGRQMAGESTDPAHPSWIPFRSASIPSASEIAAMAQDEAGAKSSGGSKPGDAAKPGNGIVHRPVVVVKDRDRTSLALLGAFSSHQNLPEVQLVFTTKGDMPTVTYKLTNASIISIRAGGTEDGTEVPVEQLRFNYEKIEIVK